MKQADVTLLTLRIRSQTFTLNIIEIYKFIIHHRNLLNFDYFPTCTKHVSSSQTIFNNIFLIAYQIFTFFIQKSFCIILAVSYLRRRVGNYLVIPNNKIFQLFSHTFTAMKMRKKIFRRRRKFFVNQDLL